MLVVRHARVATMSGPQAASGEIPLGILDDGAIGCEAGRIVYVGPSAQAPEGAETIDGRGLLVTPGLIDPHTHLLFAGDRGAEHAMRLAGATYLQVAERGGGIRSTVRATRAASDDELVASARARLGRLLRSGVTSAEVKTGYGLSIEQELRLLRLAQEAGQGSGVDVIPTVLALHAPPDELERGAYIALVAHELMPEAPRLGARGCDAFFEQGAFDAAECRTALRAGIDAGLCAHLHADQLTACGGAQLAAEMGCASAAHLERTTPEGVAAMARAKVAAVLLPLAAFFLRDTAAPARPFLEAGVTVALGSNLNPGTQRIESVSMLLAAGCLLAGLTPAQALWACTAGAARALRLSDRGEIRNGLRADLALFWTSDPAHLPYHAGVDHIRAVISAGHLVHEVPSAPIC